MKEGLYFELSYVDLVRFALDGMVLRGKITKKQRCELNWEADTDRRTAVTTLKGE